MTRIHLAALAALAIGVAAQAAEPAAAPAEVKSINLFNGKDFSGLTLFLPAKDRLILPDEQPDPAKTWSVKDGVIACTGDPAGYFRTSEKHENYTLRFEWRWTGTPGNSGCLLHIQDKDEVWPKSIEAQLMHENAGDIWVIGGTTFKEHGNAADRRVPKKEKSAEKPLGEWNEYLIECHGNTIKLYVNGVLQNVATDTTVSSGYIGWQSEGAPIEFRNLTLTPVK